MDGTTELRARHMATARALAPGLIEQLDWSADRLAAHRTERLRALVAVAVERSPWHRARLAGVRPDALDAAAMAALPAMTKADVMAHWDEIVTDDRLRLADVDAHVQAGGTYLLGEYTAIASGGSTGRRGVFVYDWDGWATFWLSILRRVLRMLCHGVPLAGSVTRESDPSYADRPMVLAWVMAAHTSHASAAMARTFDDPRLVNVRVPVTWPIEEIVAGLNDAQPDCLAAYPSIVPALVEAAQAGALTIAPRHVLCGGEPLLPEIRSAAEAAWGVPVLNLCGASESGGLSIPCALGGSHLVDDLLIVEPVDDAGRPVPVGERSTRILVTNLFNHAMPLIRYEITDEVTVLPDPCPCGSASPLVADIQGRLDDNFDYPGVPVHAHVFRTALTRRAGVAEYQVRQTPRGAALDLVCTGAVDVAALAAEVADGLRRLGLPDPDVTVRQVGGIERLPGTGKLRRFVPLAAASAGAGLP